MYRAVKTINAHVELIQRHAASHILALEDWPSPAMGRPGAKQPITADLSANTLLPRQARAITFDVDTVSLATLWEAFPGWQIDVIWGATVSSLPCDWDPGTVALLVVGVRASVTETLALCRFLAFSTAHSEDLRQETVGSFGLLRRPRNPEPRRGAPLLVLVPAGQEALVREVLEAGADSCLVLPVHTKQVVNMVADMRQGSRPGRHTLSLDRAQGVGPRRDDGGPR
jgi:CheY-like chemotaxis protein